MGMAAHASVDREAVWERLARVHDPELDRSIVELEYVDEVRIDGPRVTVRFVLPTAWCSPAFAWMMATGIRDEAGSLPDVEDVHVELIDHMHDEQIKRGVNEGLAFQDVFEDAEDGIEAVRRTLEQKSRLARQYHAVEALVEAGLAPEQIVGLTRSDLALVDDRMAVKVCDETIAVMAPAEPLVDYLSKAREVDVVTGPDDPLFAGPDGEAIASSDFESVHRRARLAEVTMSGQGGICAELHAARNGVEVDGD